MAAVVQSMAMPFRGPRFRSTLRGVGGLAGPSPGADEASLAQRAAARRPGAPRSTPTKVSRVASAASSGAPRIR